MNAVYSKDGCPHCICADPVIFLSCLSNFPAGLAEVTLVATSSEVVLKNDPEGVGLDDQKDCGLRTEMRLGTSDLHRFELGKMRAGGVPVTFSMKEFKAILQLIKDLEHRAVISIEGVGKPLIFSSESRAEVPASFVMECVLATVVESADVEDDLDLFDQGCSVDLAPSTVDPSRSTDFSRPTDAAPQSRGHSPQGHKQPTASAHAHADGEPLGSGTTDSRSQQLPSVYSSGGGYGVCDDDHMSCASVHASHQQSGASSFYHGSGKGSSQMESLASGHACRGDPVAPRQPHLSSSQRLSACPPSASSTQRPTDGWGSHVQPQETPQQWQWYQQQPQPQQQQWQRPTPSARDVSVPTGSNTGWNGAAAASDTEEDEDAIPGTPPGSPACKRACAGLGAAVL